MPLILTVRSVERPGAAAPPPLRLERRGGVIGRAPGTDWTLPDERSTVSSRHCEIAFRNGLYLIADTSTNGTSVNGRRIAAPQQLNDGDVIGIGPYQVAVAVTADAADAPPPGTPPAVAGARPPVAEGGAAVEHLLRSAGLRRADVAAGDAEILAAAGTLLRDLTAGTTMLLERRDRARKELGAAAVATAGNPLSGSGPALARLLGPPAPGALPPERAVGEAFADLEAHQLAALKAMQGAMQATLDRFSPAAIRARAGGKDDAALWQEYERGFSTGDGAFIEVFAREFRQAYEALAKRNGR